MYISQTIIKFNIFFRQISSPKLPDVLKDWLFSVISSYFTVTLYRYYTVCIKNVSRENFTQNFQLKNHKDQRLTQGIKHN